MNYSCVNSLHPAIPLNELLPDMDDGTDLINLPLDVTGIDFGAYRITTKGLDALRTAAYCDVLQSIVITINGYSMMKEIDELGQAIRVPPNERPARVVLVVLSSSSVHRVGMKAAVRRLHRADLVREMAGILA